MEPSKIYSKTTINNSDYGFITNPLDFELSDIDMDTNDLKLEGVSNMSNLFCPNSELNNVNSKPDNDSIKMFAGQIPQHFTEYDLLQMFEKFGKVYDLRILKDKTTGKSKGCCFITFFTRRAALNAQNALHNIKILPGMHHPIQMKPADSDNRNERKLFVGMLSRKYSESDVRNLFSPYGTIEECAILRDITGQSKGCAFVTYLSRQSAQNAVKSMHHCHVFEGCTSPMVVKFADTQKDKEVRRMHILHNEFNDQSQISNFIKQVSTDSLSSLVTSNNILQQLQSSGYINLSPQFSILNSLNFPQVQISNWGTVPNRPLNLQNFTNNLLINQLTAQNLTALTVNDTLALNGLLSQLNPTTNLGFLPTGFTENIYPYSSNSVEPLVRRQSWDKLILNEKQIEGPEGANLFIYHLPQELTDQKLAELFNPYGKVISAKVFIDKITKLSKCFGFVSYNDLLSAKAAIQHLNGYHILGKKLKVEIKKKKQSTKPKSF